MLDVKMCYMNEKPHVYSKQSIHGHNHKRHHVQSSPCQKCSYCTKRQEEKGVSKNGWLDKVWHDVRGKDYRCEDVDSAHDVPQVLVEAGVAVAVIEVDRSSYNSKCGRSPTKRGPA